MIIEFKVIPHRRQRYNTVGDYFKKQGRWLFRVSKMEDTRYTVLVFLHEIIEFFMCRMLGIPVEDIDLFDLAYEEARQQMVGSAPCGCRFYVEPADDPHAPYHQAHVTGTKCERLIAEALGVKWDAYEATVNQL
jgi:hypothetical protein